MDALAEKLRVAEREKRRLIALGNARASREARLPFWLLAWGLIIVILGLLLAVRVVSHVL